MTLVLILINTSVIPRIILFIHLIARSDYSIEPVWSRVDIFHPPEHLGSMTREVKRSFRSPHSSGNSAYASLYWHAESWTLEGRISCRCLESSYIGVSWQAARLLGELFDSNRVIADRVIGLGPDHCGCEAGVRRQSGGENGDESWREFSSSFRCETFSVWRIEFRFTSNNSRSIWNDLDCNIKISSRQEALGLSLC